MAKLILFFSLLFNRQITPSTSTAPTSLPTPTPISRYFPELEYDFGLPNDSNLPTIEALPTATPSPVTDRPKTATPTQSIVNTLTPTTNQIAPSPTQSNQTLTQAVSTYRLSHGLNPLTEDPRLCDLALIRAQEASVNFNHDGFQERLQNGDLNYLNFQRISENLWWGSKVDPGRIVEAWHNSSGHRQNMQGDYTLGCGKIYKNTAAFIFMR